MISIVSLSRAAGALGAGALAADLLPLRLFFKLIV